MEALRVEDLSKNFGGVRAVRNVSFSMEVGEKLARSTLWGVAANIRKWSIC